MGKQFQKFCACTAFLALCGGFTTAAAADSAGEVYEINPVTVTASRYDKRDLDVPASTQVMTQEQLRQTGAVNMQKALAFLDGVVYHQMGPGGAALSSMTSDLSIRGVNDGTLVLVNGTPINWRGLYKSGGYSCIQCGKGRGLSAAAVRCFTEVRPSAAW